MKDDHDLATNLALAAAVDAAWDFDDPVASEAIFRKLEVPGVSPADPRLHAQRLTQVARALSLQRRCDEAHATLDTIEVDTTAGPTLLEARVALERGRIHNTAGERDRARPCFERAFEIAARIDASFYAIDALHMLAITTEGDDAVALNNRAIARARESADDRARGWTGSLLNNLGWAHHDQKRWTEALSAFEQALLERRSHGTAGEVRVARWCVARCQRSMGVFEAASATHRDLLEELAGAGEVDGFVHEELAECLHALGRHDDARPHFSLAHAALATDTTVAPDRLSRLAARACDAE